MSAKHVESTGPVPARVVVARARLVGGRVILERKAPRRLHIQPGQPLHVLAHFQIREASKGRERFHVLLQSQLDDDAAPDAGRDVRDRRVLDDSQWGYLEQVYDAPAPGAHKLVATVVAAYGVEPWDGKGTPHGEDATLVVRVPVQVRALV